MKKYHVSSLIQDFFIFKSEKGLYQVYFIAGIYNMPYLLFLKKRQNLKLPPAANYRWCFRG